MSLKNKWRRLGRFEVQRVSGRYHDGTPDGRDVLWIRKRRVCATWCETPYENRHGPATLGLDLWFPPNSRRDAVAVAKAMRGYCVQKLEEVKTGATAGDK